MPVSSGSFSVGPGGDYTTWSSAVSDIASPLTGDLTFTQTGTLADSASGSISSVDLAGFNLTLQSNADFSTGWDQVPRINLSLVPGTNTFLTIAASGTGLVTIRNLRVEIDGVIGGYVAATMFDLSKTSDVEFHFYNVRMDSFDINDLIGVIADTGAVTEPIKIWNAVATGLSFGFQLSGEVIAESCVAAYPSTHSNGDSGFQLLTAAALYNSVSFGNPNADVSTAGGTFDDVATGDATGTLANITPASEFRSIDPLHPLYLVVAPGSSLATNGSATPYIAENVADIFGTPRPNGLSAGVVIGASEFVLNPFFDEPIDVAVEIEGPIWYQASKLLDVAVEIDGDLFLGWDGSPDLVIAELEADYAVVVPFVHDVSVEFDVFFARPEYEIKAPVEIDAPYAVVVAASLDVVTELSAVISSPLQVTPEFEFVVAITQAGTIDVAVDVIYGESFSIVDVLPPVDVTVDFPFGFVITVPFTLDVPVELDVGWNATGGFNNIINVAVQVTGALIARTTVPFLTREDRRIETRQRPSFPILVYHTDAKSPADVDSVVPDNEHFLVSILYNRFDDSPVFSDTGGRPGSIGKRIVSRDDDGNVLSVTYRFRAPDHKEVVGAVGSLTLYQWDNGVWNQYLTMPQRALQGMRAFAVLDPDGVYDYYGQVLGFAQHQWSYDNDFLRSLHDPRVTPTSFLPQLGDQYGLRLDSRETEIQKRTKIELAIPTFKAKGLAAAVTSRLRGLGFVASAFEAWVIPFPNGFFGQAPNSSVSTYSYVLAEGLAPAAVVSSPGARIIRVSGDYTALWSDQTEVVLQDPADPEVYEYFRVVSLTLVGPDTDVEVTRDIPGSVTTSWPLVPVEPAVLAQPHGRLRDAPDRYWPSSRIFVHLASLSGSPLSSPPTGFATFDDFFDFIFDQLTGDVLPLHVDVKAFGSLIGYDREGDIFEVADSLTITNF